LVREASMLGIVAGTLTGMGLGAVLTFAIGLELEVHAGVRFGKEPLAVLGVGIALGGLVGGLVGRWSVGTGASRRGPKAVPVWCALGCPLLLFANLLVAVQHLGTRPGQTYRWVCPESGAELSVTPSVFGSARLTPGRIASGRGDDWVLVAPRLPSPLLPWNWLALALDRSVPDPEVVIRRAGLRAD
jgi:hypothetical protein